MIDRAEVMLGLEHCKEPVGVCCECPYREYLSCRNMLVDDAYQLLRWHHFDEEPDSGKELIVSGGGNIWIDVWDGAGLKVFGAPVAGIAWMYAPEAI